MAVIPSGKLTEPTKQRGSSIWGFVVLDQVLVSSAID